MVKDIDVVVNVGDLENYDLDFGKVMLDIINMYFFNKRDCRSMFAVVKLRKCGECVVSSFGEWKLSKEEIEVSRDLEANGEDVMCVGKAWCEKHSKMLYEDALHELSKALKSRLFNIGSILDNI